MRAYRKAAPLGLCLLLSALVAGAASLPELLQKAKEEFRNGSFADVLRTLSEIEAESSKPGLERDRVALEPIVAFYRGASYASLGKKEEARASFVIFLKHQPNAALDAGLYSKKVISALEEARKSLAVVETPTFSLESAYLAAPAPVDRSAETPGPDWAEGPVRYLLTSGERQDYGRSSDTASRSAFVVDFWQRRDPNPQTPVNEARAEFEKRVAFADSRFTQQETRGSLTDRGMVFVLLGPPTYVGRKPLATGEDASDPSGLSRGRASDARVAAAASAGSRGEGNRSGGASRAAAADAAVGGPGRTMTDAASNWREVWHYRKEKLPAGVPYLQVDFEFVTKRGYGENVLQRDAQTLDTIERAKAGRRPGV